MLSWPLPKDPDDSYRLKFDWGQYRLEAGETILTSEFTIDQGAITASEPQIAGGVTSFRVAGGVDGEVCLVTNRITTSNGNQYDWTGKLRVKSR